MTRGSPPPSRSTRHRDPPSPAVRFEPSGMRSVDENRSVDRRRGAPGNAPPRAPAPVVAEVIDADVGFDASEPSAFYHRLARVREVSREHDVTTFRTPREARAYTDPMLDAVALVAHQYLSAGAVRVARVLFEGLCATRPANGYAHLGLGVCHMMQDALEPAQRALRIAVRLDPLNPQPRLNLAELAVRRGHRDDALAILRTVASLDTSDAQRRRAAALAALAEGHR